MEKLQEQVFKRIEEQKEYYATFLRDLCNIDSFTYDKYGVDAVGEKIVSFIGDYPWEIEKLVLEKSGNCYSITMNNSLCSNDMICLSAHMDTVYRKGEWEKNFSRDGDVITGAGVADCKGGIAVALLTMSSLYDCGYYSRPVRLLLQSDEEVSSVLSDRKSIDFICDRAKNATAFFNCESRLRKGEVCLERLGILRVDFLIKGKSAHSSCVFDGASAILEAAEKIIQIERQSKQNGTTYNCGVISGGTTPNVVADSCTFTVDVRIADDNAKAEALAFLKEIAAKSFVNGTHSVITIVSERKPMPRTRENIVLLRRANAVCRKNGWHELRAISKKGGSDAADTTFHKIPTLDSMGILGANVHSVGRETADLSSLVLAAQEIASLIINI